VVLSACTSVVDNALMAVVVRLAICRVVSDETIDMQGLPLGSAPCAPIQAHDPQVNIAALTLRETCTRNVVARE